MLDLATCIRIIESFKIHLVIKVAHKVRVIQLMVHQELSLSVSFVHLTSLGLKMQILLGSGHRRRVQHF